MKARSLLFTSLLVAQTCTALARENADRIVAIIGNEMITYQEILNKAQPALSQIDASLPPSEQEERKNAILKQTLDTEIDETLIHKEIESNKDKLGITDKDVDAAIDEVQQMNHITKEQLQSALYSQGMSWNEYRTKLKQQLERSRIIQFRVQGKVQIQDTQAKKRCEELQKSNQPIQVCASHILFMVPKSADPNQINRIAAQASKILAEIKTGADFATYAMKYSDDKAAPDGNLGCFSHGEMVEPFEKAAFQMQPQQISSLVRTEFGFHIIKVTDKRTLPPPSCDSEEQLNQYKNVLYQEEVERYMKIWLADLKRKSFVEIKW